MQESINLKKEVERQTSILKLALGDNHIIDELKSEDNIYKFIDCLKLFSFRYSVIITSFDTPCGPDFSPALSEKLKSLGLKVDLSDKYRMEYKLRCMLFRTNRV